MVNQVGDTSTVTPFGGSTAHRFKSAGCSSGWLHDPPVAASTCSRLMLDNEHRKATYSPSPEQKVSIFLLYMKLCPKNSPSLQKK
ncbi:hypothetical protein BVRB_8g185540 [Beta vulgaris subsp. vulgaris]|nr:hypothetical protein BVRB_8g185540 [Beta vulgaris subsp. vulgaris]